MEEFLTVLRFFMEIWRVLTIVWIYTAATLWEYGGVLTVLRLLSWKYGGF
jgi:hypothetical protein